MVQALGGVRIAEGTNYVTTRGLEMTISKARHLEKLQLQALAWDAVLDEQEDQWENDEDEGAPGDGRANRQRTAVCRAH